MATNVLQLHRLAETHGRIICSFRLAGVVCAVNPAKGMMILQDDSGAELLKLDLPVQSLQPGERVRLAGNARAVAHSGFGLEIGNGAVVDNDGVHAMDRKFGAMYLNSGLHPIRLDWFNNLGDVGLGVTYQGPGQPRQRIPDSALFCLRAEPSGGGASRMGGLNYGCYEGSWGDRLPDFNRLTPVKIGTAANFDLGVRTRDEHVGLEFTGYLTVSQDGVYTFETESDDGSRLFVDESSLHLESLGSAPVPIPRRLDSGPVLERDKETQWVEVEGMVNSVNQWSNGLELELDSGTERMRLEVADGGGLSPALLLHRRIRAAGVFRRLYTVGGERTAGELSVLCGRQIEYLEKVPDLGGAQPLKTTLPVLTTVEQVKRLKREEAHRGYPVNIQGVITLVQPETKSVVLQDATCAIHVHVESVLDFETAYYWQIQGITDSGDFAPIVLARQSQCLGAGRLPDPTPATWDQLMNGSLDTQYAEIRGVVTDVETNRLELLLPGGKISLKFPDLKPGLVKRYENASICVRGCLFPIFDHQTHRLQAGEVEIRDAIINSDESLPVDLFSTPLKHAADLLLFDLQAGALQRVKVAGQILGKSDGQYFMLDGANGLRLIANNTTGAQVGDIAEAVGFPELGGSSPVLREAWIRKTGHTSLPKPKRLAAENLIGNEHDATRVQIEGVLVNLLNERKEQMLELQVGSRTILARLGGNDEWVRSLAPGSRLELTGVYSALAASPAARWKTGSFELMLNSPSDIRVVARPPWWTPERLLWLLALATTFFMAMLGAIVMHSKRKMRRQLLASRQAKAEFAAVNGERNRLARELHDSLEQSLIGVALQLDAGLMTLPAGTPEASQHFELARKMLDQSHGEVRRSVLDLRSQMLDNNDLPDALRAIGQELCDKSGVLFRVETAGTMRRLPAHLAHHWLRIGQEAITNAVRHARPREIRVTLMFNKDLICLKVRDDGRGFKVVERCAEPGHFGLIGMRERAKALGGRFTVESECEAGTTIMVEVACASEVSVNETLP